VSVGVKVLVAVGVKVPGMGVKVGTSVAAMVLVATTTDLVGISMVMSTFLGDSAVGCGAVAGAPQAENSMMMSAICKARFMRCVLSPPR
jgi:hypothetical protein